MADTPATQPVDPLAKIDAIVPVTGLAVTASRGTVAHALGVKFPISGLTLHAIVGDVFITGQLVTRDFAYPFQGPHYTSPGLTVRQWYAAQAMAGFISSAAIPANLVGKVSEYAFKVADSMLEFEAAERSAEEQTTIEASIAPAALTTASLADALALKVREAKDKKTSEPPLTPP